MRTGTEIVNPCFHFPSILSYLWANHLSLKRDKMWFEISLMCQKLRFVEFFASYDEKLVVCSKVGFDVTNSQG